MIDHDNLEEKKKAFKYPQVASDILSADQEKIFEFFKT